MKKWCQRFPHCCSPEMSAGSSLAFADGDGPTHHFSLNFWKSIASEEHCRESVRPWTCWRMALPQMPGWDCPASLPWRLRRYSCGALLQSYWKGRPCHRHDLWQRTICPAEEVRKPNCTRQMASERWKGTGVGVYASSKNDAQPLMNCCYESFIFKGSWVFFMGSVNLLE